MKYSAFSHRLDALEKRLNLRRVSIRIEGGVPPDWKPAAAEPPGADLKRQHATRGGKWPWQVAPPAVEPASQEPERQKAAGGLPKRS
jgi:hypothetical protein